MAPVTRTLLAYPLLPLAAIMLMAAAAFAPDVLSLGNMLQVLRQASVMAIIATGVTFVVLCGRLDVSFGSLLSLCLVVVIGLHDRVGPSAAIGAALAVGVAVGCVNGLLVSYLRLNSLVTTLGMMSLLQGIAYIVAGGGFPIVSNPEATWFAALGRGYLLGVPTPVWIAAVVAVLAGLLLSRTNYGQAVRAVGGNETASVFSAIDARAIVFSTYVIAGLLTAVASVLLGSRVMSAQSNTGAGYELLVLSAIFLGGTSLAGGIGGVGRSVMGVLVLGFIGNALVILGTPYQAQWVVSTVIIIAAVWLDAATRRGTVLA